MPIRAFVSQNMAQLTVTLAALEKALQSGSINELRVSGIMTSTTALKATDVRLLYDQCRYEMFLRANSLPDSDGNKITLVAQFTNPYREKGMKVHSRSSVGVFGYPVPAPDVPPSP